MFMGKGESCPRRRGRALCLVLCMTQFCCELWAGTLLCIGICFLVLEPQELSIAGHIVTLRSLSRCGDDRGDWGHNVLDRNMAPQQTETFPTETFP